MAKMTPEEYKQLWLSKEPGTQTEYNNCRFAEDKLSFAKEWLRLHVPFFNENGNSACDETCKQKLRMIEDKAYCELCSRWADKIVVNNELEQMGFKDIIIPNYLIKYDSVSPEDLEELPEGRLIMKCNHGSGWNKIFNKHNAGFLSQINEWLELNYAYITGYEAQYENIRPGVIVQPLISEQPPTDYGFYCSHGKIIGISITKKLSKSIENYIAFVDENGKKMDWRVGIKPQQENLQKAQIQRLKEMEPYVLKIAEKFDFVRVDMYHQNGRVYFGETTFTPCSGRLDLVEW